MPVYLELIEPNDPDPTTFDPSFSDYDIIKVENVSGAWMVHDGTLRYISAGSSFGKNMQQLGSQVHHVTEALFDFLTNSSNDLYFPTFGGP